MTHLRSVVVVLGILWAASCSSTSNQTTTPQPTRQVDRFAVSTADGSGTFTPALNIQESGNTTTVTVKVQEAADLSEAYLHLNYDSTQYTPTDVKFGDFLGAEDQVVTLALTEKAGDVQLGAAQIANGGAFPQDGAGVLATVTFEKTPFTGGRIASAFPDGDANRVTDLKIKSQVGNDVTLEWTERNKGDYNNNGIVGISDLSPIALYINQSVAATSDPIHANMIDGDQNGMVTIADLGPIGGNLDNHVTGYNIYSNAGGTVMVTNVPRPAQGSIDSKRPVVYSLQLTTSGGEEFTVRPVGTASSETGLESNVAAPIASEPGEPAPPTGLTATVDDEIAGAMEIRLNWTVSSSTDRDEYRVERKLSTDPDTSFTEIITLPGAQFQWDDDSVPTDADYDYRIWTIDNEGLTSLTPSNVATGNPYVQVIPVPTGVVATTGSQAAGVDVEWDDVLDPNVYYYRVYRKGPTDADFVALNPSIPKIQGSRFEDSGLTEHETYEYYVTSLGFNEVGESAPSATVSASASDALVLQIDSLTTDKTTHHTSGSEPVSNITGVANTPLATWTWSATDGTVTGTGDSVTWEVDGAPAGTVTLTATAHFGAQQVSQDLLLHVTSETIKTTYNIEAAGNIGVAGKFVDFSRPSVQQPTAPYKSFKTFFDDDNVVLYNMWEIWCGPCRGEMPFMHEWAEDYEAYGYRHVAHSSTYSLQQTADWLNTPGLAPNPPVDSRPWDKFYAYNVSDAGNGAGDPWAGDMPLWNQFWSQYGPSGMSLPRTLLFDKDGYCRKWSSTIPESQDATWRNLIKELTGAP